MKFFFLLLTFFLYIYIFLLFTIFEVLEGKMKNFIKIHTIFIIKNIFLMAMKMPFVIKWSHQEIMICDAENYQCFLSMQLINQPYFLQIKMQKKLSYYQFWADGYW